MQEFRRLILAATLGLCSACSAHAEVRALSEPTAGAVPDHGVIGVGEAQLSPEFWVQRLADPDRELMATGAIAAQNERLLHLDDSVHDLAALPETLDGQTIIDSISRLSAPPKRALYDVSGNPVPAVILQGLVQSLALDAIPRHVPVRHGLVLRRTALRSFPTDLRAFSSPGETDIDRFQESALFPGTPVVILHESRDGQWLWVISPNYQAWMSRQDVAEGTRAQVLEYVSRAPYRIVTGAKPTTVFTRERPELSELQLDMGVRVPLARIAPDALVNGQHPYTAWAVELPVRDAQGRLSFAPALLQKNQDTSPGYLPLTQANLIRQGFKFLGERYGWGHAYNGRDCSGFVSEIYRSMGVELPRNTRDQSISPALDHEIFSDTSPPGARQSAVDALEVGDLVYIPGHVMMMIGRIDGAPYVIHDTNGGSYLDADGNLRSIHLNGVAVTPLLPLRFSQGQSYVDRITSIVRIRH